MVAIFAKSNNDIKMIAGKSKTKQPIGRDLVKAEAIKWTAGHLGCSAAYVRGLLNGNNLASSNNAELILKTYKKKYAELKAVLS